MPSSSARCAQLPRAADKVPFYAALKKFRDFLNGVIPHIDDSECVFSDQRIRDQNQTESSEKINPPLADHQTSLTFMGTNGGSSRDPGDCGNPSGSECQVQFSNEKCVQGKAETGSVSSANSQRPFSYAGGDNQMVNSSSQNSSAERSYLSVFVQQQPQEKKKRGRPKKIKDQEVIDPTGNKISLSGQPFQHHDFNNILNLSMISGGDSAEIPKKKRGRPKKIKPTIDNVIGAKQNKHSKPNANPKSVCVQASAVHSISMEHMAQSPQSNHQMTPSLYNTPPPSHILYTASASPMASPAQNCNYTHIHGHGTPPVGQSSVIQSTPPIDTQSDHPPLKQTQLSSLNQGIELRDQSNLGDTPPPNSPNICVSTDFHAPENSEKQECPGGQCKVRQQIPHQADENLPHNTDLNVSHQPENYQLWISSQSHSHVTPQKVLPQQLPQSLMSYHQEESDNWSRYDNQNSNPYVVISAHHQHLSPRLVNERQQTRSGSLGTDVARKSLSVLESLVDQIPATRDHEPTTVALMDSRLVGIQQLSPQQKRHQETSTQEETCRSTNDDRINNSLSISSLVASVPNSTVENDTSYSGSVQGNGNRDIIIGSCRNSIEYPIHGSSEYVHHASHLVSTNLGVAINNSEPNPLTHPHSHNHPHPHPIYMDPTHISNHMSHLPPVNVNSVYGPSAYGSHPQHNTGEYPTNHSHYSLGSPVPGAGPGSTTTFHVPSPNYPYGPHPYSHTPPQANYSSYTHPHSHHNHPTQHLSVFDRLKPSDRGGYGGF